MWNKLFKKKEKKQSSKSGNKSESDKINQAAASSSGCFSFRGGQKLSGDFYKPIDTFNFLQYESEAYRNPGEARICFVSVDWVIRNNVRKG